MRFVALTIKQGLFSDQFTFPSDVNIIHSEKNSVGKTTLLRFLMYSLGYPIPSTRGINFGKYELHLQIVNATGESCCIIRNRDFITLECGETSTDYSLPFDINELHSHVFGINNSEVLENLLGAYYVDQEKGWTLLNRGKAIGSIHFSIEGLIRGLSSRSNEGLTARLVAVKRETLKYRHMLDVAQYQAEINALGETVAFDTPADHIERELDILYCERKPISDELERIKKVIRNNTSFKSYITSMQIRVMDRNGEEIPVNEDTIIGFKDDVEFLVTKRKLMAGQLAEMDRRIGSLKQRQEKENTLFSVQTRIQEFDADISKMKVDAVATERIVRQLEHERKSLEDAITESLKQDNPLISELHTLIAGYATELGVDERYVRPSTDYIFTSDLKSLTGAIFHKTVFAFKISYIKLIAAHAGVKLPIVLDSPSGREVDEINVTDMVNILIRDFAEHQIIIASIHLYNFPKIHILELKNKLLSY